MVHATLTYRASKLQDEAGTKYPSAATSPEQALAAFDAAMDVPAALAALRACVAQAYSPSPAELARLGRALLADMHFLADETAKLAEVDCKQQQRTQRVLLACSAAGQLADLLEQLHLPWMIRGWRHQAVSKLREVSKHGLDFETPWRVGTGACCTWGNNPRPQQHAMLPPTRAHFRSANSFTC